MFLLRGEKKEEKLFLTAFDTLDKTKPVVSQRYIGGETRLAFG